MDAIKKKMQSMKSETEALLEHIVHLEEQTAIANNTAEQCDQHSRDIGKRVARTEAAYDEASTQLISVDHRLEDKEKCLGIAEQEISSLYRRYALMEEEAWTAERRLGKIVEELANTCRQADDTLRGVRSLEVKCFNNEENTLELEKLLAEANHMNTDSEKKLDESTRRLGMMEEELKKTLERASLAEEGVEELESSLKQVGESMKALEVSEEKALNREEKYKEQIRNLTERLKTSEARTEYGEMTITKLNHRIDDIEDEIVREKHKIQKINDELNGTFDDIFTKY